MNINEFKAALKFGGARSNLFRVSLTNPINGAGDNTLPFLCRATSLPAKAITPIDQTYFGRTVKFAGVTRNYEDWSVTVINDEDFLIKNAMEEWANAINSPEGNTRRTGGSSPTLYKSVGDITQISQAGDVLRTYRMLGVWPNNVGDISMDWGTDDIQTYQVTFSVDLFYVSSEGTTGIAGGV